jgi:hypothetical protein
MGRHSGITTKKLTGAITMAPELPRTTSSTRWGRVVPAALYTAALGAALTAPAIASALPPDITWDQKAYDKCVQDVLLNPYLTGSEKAYRVNDCCIKAGGVFNTDTDNCDHYADDSGNADLQTGPQINLPPGGLPQATLAPANPTPGAVTSTPAPNTGG